MQAPTPPYGPLTIPKAFQRISSAHAILVALILSDLTATILWLLLGAFLGDPIWWALLFLAKMGHASVLFDITSILLCVSVCSASMLPEHCAHGIASAFLRVRQQYPKGRRPIDCCQYKAFCLI